MERLINDATDGRQPKTIVFSYRLLNAKEKSQSLPVSRFKGLVESIKEENTEEGGKIIANTCLNVFVNDMGESRWIIRWAGVTATNFTEVGKNSSQITDFFKVEKSSKEEKPNKKQKTRNTTILDFFTKKTEK